MDRGECKMMEIRFLKDEIFILIALGLKISRAPFGKSINDLYQECLADRQASKELVNRVMNKNRHLIPGDFLDYAITFENISRFAAMYLWRNISTLNQIFGAGLETSFRRVKPVSYMETLGKLGKLTFESYRKAIRLEVPTEDAKFILSEGTLTRMIFSAPPRYLVKLARALQETPLSELKEIGREIELLVEQKFGLKIPKETLVSKWEFWGESQIKGKTNLSYQGVVHSISINMKTEASLSTLADLVRQRQMLCIVEPLLRIAQKRTFVIPSSFPRKVEKSYRKIAKRANEEQNKLIRKQDPRFVYSLLLGQETGVNIYGKGAGVIGTSNARTSSAAYWGIRNKVGIPLTRMLAQHGILVNQIGPRCWWQKKCTEPKDTKAMCKAFAQSKGKWKGTLEQLLQVLTEPYETFTV